MSKQLRVAVRSIILETLTEENGAGVDHKVVNFEGFKGYDLEARCNHCNVDLWLVWRANDPARRWTECGGIGEGSCESRLHGDEFSSTNDSGPPTKRSVYADPSSGPRVKRSV
jgi:hypothetical protein